MSWLLCLAAVVSVGHWVTVDATITCSWKEYRLQNIAGGVERYVSTLSACQSTCLSESGCKSVDWNPDSNRCWVLTTKDGKKPSADIDHYDYDCIDLCSPNPCSNGGQCSSTSTGYSCTCSNGYTGDRCQTAPVVDPCAQNPCQNGGQCVPNSAANTYTCSCTSGFTGTTCQTVVDKKVDITKNPNFLSALTCNFKGNLLDLFNSPYTMHWTVDSPQFPFDWPTDFATKPIKRFKWSSSSNLASIRLKITNTYGQDQLTGLITSSPYEVTGVDSVKKITVILNPVDPNQNVTIDGVNFMYCAPALLWGGCTLSSIFKANSLGLLGEILGILELALNVVTLGLLQRGADGGLKYTQAPEFPTFDINLKSLSIGPSQFHSVTFGQLGNVKNLYVEVTQYGSPVNVYNSNGISSNSLSPTFDQATGRIGIWFGQSVIGDRIKVKLLPTQIGETSCTVSVRGASVLIL